MRHPDALQLHSYLDGELEPQSRQHLEAHLRACAACRQALQVWEQLGAAVRRTRPTAAQFCAEGEFWRRLAGRLPKQRPTAWPFMPYLPPLLLGMLGALVETLVSLVLVLYALIGLGMLPPLGPWIAEQLPSLVAHPLLEGSVYAWLGISGDEAARALAGAWNALHVMSQDAVVFGGMLVALAIVWAILVALLASWAMCWMNGRTATHKM